MCRKYDSSILGQYKYFFTNKSNLYVRWEWNQKTTPVGKPPHSASMNMTHFWLKTESLKKNIVPLVSDFFFLKLRENCQTLLFSNICIMFVVWMDFCSPESQFSLQYFFVFLLLTKYPKTLYPVPLQKFLLFLSMGIENLLFPAQTFQQEWFQCNFFLPISDGDKIIG